MAMGGPDSLDNVTLLLLDRQGGSVVLHSASLHYSLSSVPMAMLNDSPALLDTVISLLTAHESSLCPS